MYDNKFKKAIYDYVEKTGKDINSLSEKDYSNILIEIADKSFIEECMLQERKEIINPMYKKAQEILLMAYQTNDMNEIKKLAKKAYETSSECIEALILWENSEEDHNKKLEILEKGIEYEKEKLKRLGYFKKEYIGDFYSELETRNYIRLLHNKLEVLLFIGRISLAKNLCLEILELNNNDDLGIKYILLGIYAYQEDEKELLELKDTIHEDTVETLLPLLILFYKLNKIDRVQEVLLKLNNISKEFISFFKSYLANCKDEDIEEDDFSNYLLLTMNNINFLINATPGIVFYIVNKSE